MMRRRLRRAGGAATALVAASAVALPAGAGADAFPGRSGEIAFLRAPGQELWAMAPDGSGTRRLTTQAAKPAYSPDGRRLVVTSFDDEGQGTGLDLMNADGTGRRRVPGTTADDCCASFSPAGRRLVFESKRAGRGDFDLYTVGLDGRNLRRLTYSKHQEVGPTFSPDGRWIAFCRSGDIHLTSADGRRERRLTSMPEPAGACPPHFSPDGRRIVFGSNRGGQSRIWMMDADGSSQQRLTHSRLRDHSPVFSPDGRRIAYIRERSTTAPSEFAGIWTMKADGSDKRQLTQFGTNIAWQPLPRR